MSQVDISLRLLIVSQHLPNSGALKLIWMCFCITRFQIWSELGLSFTSSGESGHLQSTSCLHEMHAFPITDRTWKGIFLWRVIFLWVLGELNYMATCYVQNTITVHNLYKKIVLWSKTLFVKTTSHWSNIVPIVDAFVVFRPVWPGTCQRWREDETADRWAVPPFTTPRSTHPPPPPQQEPRRSLSCLPLRRQEWRDISWPDYSVLGS